MINGFASPEETAAYARSHPDLACRQLGSTGLLASQAGFGCYRVNLGNAPHEHALKKAIAAGINLIDTSTNYADGGSEKLIGKVLGDLISAGTVSRQQIIVVSKVGYLQGQNYEFSQQRRAQGKPFEELVDFGEGLAHCIHPEFLADQLERTQERLNLETVDFYLLHNPEYYLEWAAQHQIGPAAANDEYYRRIRVAFDYLEQQVVKGRLRHYGVSSNTFPAATDDPEFTRLETLLEIAEALGPDHHFRLIQLPLNVLERGAVMEKNQSEGKTVLELAAAHRLAVLTNRPLNAFTGNKLLRLADVPIIRRMPTDDIIQHIRQVALSEKKFGQQLLPELALEIPMQNRVKEQLAIGDVLKHHWRHFGSYERWREIKTGHILARVRGVMEFLAPQQAAMDALSDWMDAHMTCLETALNAVESIYSEPAAVDARRISRAISTADPDWAGAMTLSQMAIDAVRSTAGVSSVLVGMRREPYVSDVVAGLKRPVSQKPREHSWEKLDEARK